ncbi:hypothetical protein, partial [Pontimonas sp.]|uniref:hypothetical protein n=1 Tax=Pontimonas sp. TaxID=2304492 RepID=UPI00286FFF6E
MSGVAREPSAAVYRRRRIAVFGGLLAVIVVVALIIWRPSLGGTPSATEEPEEDQLTEEVVPVAECTDSQIELIAETDEVRYAPGAEPQVWLTVRNTGATECELEVGSDVQELMIDSGARDNPDLIWLSTHCQEGGAPMTITLQPGAERSTAAIGWDRTRSNPETCNDERTQMPG